jgi:vacuolar protein-sorting-associated protein 4
MFQIHVGSTPCQLVDEDYQTLADRTEGYSGSDIAIVVRDALMQPVRKVISATHFKHVEDPENGVMKWTPCSHGDPKAVEKTWTDIGSDELLEPPLKITDFLKSLDTTPPTVNEADVKRHLDWTREAGACVFRYLRLLVLTPSQGATVLELIRIRTVYLDALCIPTRHFVLALHSQ